jgi:predicted glycogen debranching enzyme
MISFDSDICANFEAASSREWLETNGVGGFASSTIPGANTRRYHGLLTAATKPPLGRITMLSKLEETVIIDGESFELSSNQYPGKVHPEGYKFLKSFRLDPFPIWVYEVGDLEIEKRVFMIDGENSVVVRYSLAKRTRSKVELELRPLLSFVDYHHLQHENEGFAPTFESSGNLVALDAGSEFPPLYFNHLACEIEPAGYWYRNFVYAIERERGFDFTEDLYQPFVLRGELKKTTAVIISTEIREAKNATRFEKAEVKRRNALMKKADAKDDFSKQLVLAADQFIVKRGNGHTIIAGYPWFSDWGRDTMISLPGLTLTTNRPDIAKGILLEFASSISQGMLPNRFPDAGDEAEYNTVDATLWYFEAIRAYAEFTGDYDFVREHLYAKLVDIIHWHLRGTRYNIHVDTDGLLYAGEPGVQLTWMDAKIGDLVITPRIGKPVEIQALWYNALKIMADLASRFGDNDDQAKYSATADLAKLSFNAVFWNEDAGCLYDVAENGHRDPSIRPNQIFAVSLPYSMLDEERSRKVVDRVQAELFTPVGLRSLSPNDPQYVPIYIGSPFDRDSAYHQGTVWGWLIGGFVDAYRRVYPNQNTDFLQGFQDHLFEAGLGQISEIFDAEPPHSPRGCFAQAWSVAEVLRILKIEQ